MKMGQKSVKPGQVLMAAMMVMMVFLATIPQPTIAARQLSPLVITKGGGALLPNVMLGGDALETTRDCVSPGHRCDPTSTNVLCCQPYKCSWQYGYCGD